MNSIPQGFKRCTKCGKIKPATLEYFYAVSGNKGNKDGFKPRCKSCMIEDGRQKQGYYDNEFERLQDAANARGTKLCKDCLKEFPANEEYFFGQTNRFGKRILNPYCRECHKKRNRENTRIWYGNNQEHCIDYAMEWTRNHPDRKRESDKHYRENNYEAVSKRKRAYTHRKRSANGSFTQSDIDLLFKTQKGKCWWCGKKLGKTYHIDHRIPLSRGGSNNPENLCLTCPKCNLSKSDKLPHEWSDRLL